MNEASKTRAIWSDFEKSLVAGNGIDIGCGPDPISPTAKGFDLDDGDANKASEYFSEQFDYCFSAHCLEHMIDPKRTIQDWWSLIKPGGHMILIVPDEDLYEQGYFPSLFNRDHKHTFTIYKTESWSPHSHNVLDLIELLPGASLVNIKLQNNDYDMSKLKHSRHSRKVTRAFIKLLKFFKINPNDRLANLMGCPIDQTRDKAMAQIQVILKKNKSNEQPSTSSKYPSRDT